MANRTSTKSCLFNILHMTVLVCSIESELDVTTGTDTTGNSAVCYGSKHLGERDWTVTTNLNTTLVLQLALFCTLPVLQVLHFHCTSIIPVVNTAG